MTSQLPKLSSIKIEGFRSCEKTLFRPHPELSVLIGPNGAGKTNILQAVKLLADEGRYRARNESSSSQCRLTAEFQIADIRLGLRSSIKYVLDQESIESVIDVADEWRSNNLPRSKRGPNRWLSVESAFGTLIAGRSGSVRARHMIRLRMHQNRHQQLNLFNDLPERLFPSALKSPVRKVTEFRESIAYYSASRFTNPAKCPTSIEIDEDKDLVKPGNLARHQHQHQMFLLDLYRLRVFKPDDYASYLSIVGRLGLKLISSIQWKQVKVASSQVDVKSGGKVEKRNRQRVLIVPSVKIGDDKLSFSQLSEGTFKTLALIFYILTDASALMLIEEPEVCVHHGLLSSIVALIKSQSAKKQIIVSTHSDYVLDQVKPDSVFSVTRDSEMGTIVRSIAKDYPRQTIQALREYLHTEGNLGEFWRQGGFDN